MGRSEVRRPIVKDLRTHAKECGVPRVRDDASRADVAKMMCAIRASDHYKDIKDDVEIKFKEYGATFSTVQEAPSERQADAERASLVSSNDKRRAFRLRGKSFLFTGLLWASIPRRGRGAGRRVGIVASLARVEERKEKRVKDIPEHPHNRRVFGERTVGQGAHPLEG